MARRGRFGRLPRSAPDLTSTIVAILREYQSQRDTNIQDAWEKGGTFEGKKVTDEMILQHWKDRRNEVSRDDPLWDSYNQSVNNLTFGISNSKQELGYAQKKINDTQMAAFYTQWAGHYPQNSEAWRRMMNLAAQYSERAKAASSSGGHASRESNYQNNVFKAQSKGIAFDTVTNILTEMARTTGILNDDKETLSDTRAYEDDSGRLLQLIDTFNTAKTIPDGKGGLIDMVKYRKGLTEYIRKNGDPNFDGDFSYQGWLGMRQGKASALNTWLRLAQQTGHKGDITKVTKQLASFAGDSLRIGLIDEQKSYEEYRHAWNAVLSDPNSSPIEKKQATDLYTQQLEGLKNRATGERGGDPMVGSSFEGHLNNELIALSGQPINAPTPWDDTRGAIAAAKPDPKDSDAFQTAQSVNALNADVPLLFDGQHAMVLVDASGKFALAGGGVETKVVPLNMLPDNTAFIAGVHGPGSVTLIGADGQAHTLGTDGIVTGIRGAPVNVQGQQVNPQTGIPIPDGWAKPQTNTSDTDVANIFTMPDGSKVYQYVDTYGKKQYSEVPPWADGVTAHVAGDGSTTMTVNVPGAYFDPKGSVIAMPYLNTPGDLETVHRSTMAAWMANAGKVTKELPSVSTEAIRAAIKTESGGGFVQERVGTNPDGTPSYRTTYNADTLAAIDEVDQLRADYLNADPKAAAALANMRQNFGAEYQDTLRGALGSKERGAIVAQAAAGAGDMAHNRDLAALETAARQAAVSGPRGRGILPSTFSPDFAAARAQELLGHPIAPSAAQKAAQVGAAQQAGGQALAAFLQGQMQGGILSAAGVVGNPVVMGAAGPIYHPVSTPTTPKPLVGPTGNTTPSTFAPPTQPGRPVPDSGAAYTPPPPTSPPPYRPPGGTGTSGSSGTLPSTGGKVTNPYYNPYQGATTHYGQAPHAD
jgi:hypothetical protein